MPLLLEKLQQVLEITAKELSNRESKISRKEEQQRQLLQQEQKAAAHNEKVKRWRQLTAQQKALQDSKETAELDAKRLALTQRIRREILPLATELERLQAEAAELESDLNRLLLPWPQPQYSWQQLRPGSGCRSPHRKYTDARSCRQVGSGSRALAATG